METWYFWSTNPETQHYYKEVKDLFKKFNTINKKEKSMQDTQNRLYIEELISPHI